MIYRCTEDALVFALKLNNVFLDETNLIQKLKNWTEEAIGMSES